MNQVDLKQTIHKTMSRKGATRVNTVLANYSKARQDMLTQVRKFSEKKENEYPHGK